MASPSQGANELSSAGCEPHLLSDRRVDLTLIGSPHARRMAVRVLGVDRHRLMQTEEERHDLRGMRQEALSVSRRCRRKAFAITSDDEGPPQGRACNEPSTSA